MRFCLRDCLPTVLFTLRALRVLTSIVSRCACAFVCFAFVAFLRVYSFIHTHTQAARAKENKGKDPDGLKSVFGQLFTQLKNTKADVFRGRKNQQMWQVAFLGEGSIGVSLCLSACVSLSLSVCLPFFHCVIVFVCRCGWPLPRVLDPDVR